MTSEWTPPPQAIEAAWPLERILNGEWARLAAAYSAPPLHTSLILRDLSYVVQGLVNAQVHEALAAVAALADAPDLDAHGAAVVSVADLRTVLTDHADTVANIRANTCVNVVAHRHPDDCVFYSTGEGTDRG